MTVEQIILQISKKYDVSYQEVESEILNALDFCDIENKRDINNSITFLTNEVLKRLFLTT